MNRMLDIFRVDSCGPLWLEVAETLEQARTRVEELVTLSPGILDHELGPGNRYDIKCRDLGTEDKSRHAKWVNHQRR